MGLTCGVDSLDKMAKNCIKIRKSVFWGQNSGGGRGMGDKPIFWVVGGSPCPPTRGNPDWLSDELFISNL